MNRITDQRHRRWWEADFFSPKDFVRRAALICLVFAVAHLFGLREFTSILNGTPGSTAVVWEISVLLGVTYIVLYLAFVLLVPTLLLAAALLAIGKRTFENIAKQNTEPLYKPALNSGFPLPTNRN